MKDMRVLQNSWFTSLRGSEATEAILYLIVFIEIASSLTLFVPRKDGIKVYFS